MKILQAVPKDLIEVLYLLKVCVNDMNQKGQKHWNNAYPGTDYMIEAIGKKTLYLIKDIGIAKGLVVLSKEEPEEYGNKIQWKGASENILFIRFLAVHPRWHGKGIAKRLMEYAENYAKDKSYKTMRVDIFSGVDGAEKLCKDMGFNQTGEFHSDFQQTPYYAYEKDI